MKNPSLLLVLLCAGCLAATDVDELLTVATASSKTELGVTDTAVIRTTLFNHSDQTVKVQTPSCGPFFFIVDSLNHSILPPQNTCSIIALPKITVAAHDSAVFEDPWAGEGQTKTGDKGRLAPGTYALYSAMYGSNGHLIESRSVYVKLLP